ncbi:MAG: cold shock domain-containing protein [Acidimicrobiia bacterium]
MPGDDERLLLVLNGRVVEFDADRGLGRIDADDGRSFRFHCTQIADGSRSIPVGAEVRFDVLAKLGRYEATAIAAR